MSGDAGAVDAADIFFPCLTAKTEMPEPMTVMPEPMAHLWCDQYILLILAQHPSAAVHVDNFLSDNTYRYT